MLQRTGSQAEGGRWKDAGVKEPAAGKLMLLGPDVPPGMKLEGKKRPESSLRCG